MRKHFSLLFAGAAVLLMSPLASFAQEEEPETQSAAQDADEIKAATLEHFEFLNAGDAAAHVQLHLPGVSSFDDGEWEEGGSLEDQIASLQAAFDAGLKADVTVRDLKVKVYGDAAVVTGYVVGTVTDTDGTTAEITGARSTFMIRQGGRWLEAHSHLSTVTEELSE
jgi:ketosteroid isomerase-like protein